MTVDQRIRMEATEITIFNIIKNLLKKGYDDSLIAEIIDLSVKKVQEIIQKIKESNQ